MKYEPNTDGHILKRSSRLNNSGIKPCLELFSNENKRWQNPLVCEEVEQCFLSIRSQNQEINILNDFKFTTQDERTKQRHGKK